MENADTVTSLISLDNLTMLARVAFKTPPGDFLEFGVYRGGSALLLDEVCKRQGRHLHLFDTFTGIPERSEIDKHLVGDFGDTTLAAVRAALPDATYHVGFFPDTLPIDLAGIAFAHVDCDQYASVKSACEILPGHMVKGGVIYFDDYGTLEGATTAVIECLPAHRVLPNGKAIYVIE